MTNSNNITEMLNEPLSDDLDYDTSVTSWFKDELPEREPKEKEAATLVYEDVAFETVRPPYWPFYDQYLAKVALTSAFRNKSFLLLYGYAGCGKATILKQMAMQNQDLIFYFPHTKHDSPSGLLGKIAEHLNLSVKQRTSELDSILNALKQFDRLMLIFDGFKLDNQIDNNNKLDLITTIHDETGIPVVISGGIGLFQQLYNERNHEKYETTLSCLTVHEMKGMQASDAHDYLKYICEHEKVNIPVRAREALVNIAANSKEGMEKFIKILGEIMTEERRDYYMSPGKSLPENAKCVGSYVRNGQRGPENSIICSPPVTPDVLIADSQRIQRITAKYIAGYQQQPKRKEKKRSKENPDVAPPKDSEES